MRAAWTSSGWALTTVLVVADGVCAAGACCTADSCVPAASPADCSSIGGVFLDGAECATGACGIGACCSEVACLDGLDVFACVASGREPAGVGTVCADDPCGNESGACCVPGDCVIDSGLACAARSGVWLGADTVCAETACAAGACCDLATGACADDTPITDCVSPLQRFGSDTSCGDLEPPCSSQVGTCCTTGGCLETLESLCAAGGGSWAGDADCSTCPPVGACCVNGTDCVTLTAAGCAEQGFTWLGADTTCGRCPPPPTCGDDALFGHDPAVPPSFFGGTSELGSGFKRWDDFSGLTVPIERLTWWGIDLAPLSGGGWAECADAGSFIIAFHADDGGLPAAAATCTYPVVPQQRVHPLSYSGTPLNVYTAELSTPCALTDGWLSIVGAGDADCWFLWMSALEPGESVCAGCPGGVDFEDFSFCLGGPDAGQCKRAEVCGDADADGLRDDLCMWWDCVGGACVGTAVPYGDVGGAEGDCMPDGVVDDADRDHVLDCFATIRSATNNPYPCAADAPRAINTDIAGAFGACVPDGICDGHDAFAVDRVIQGGEPCDCAGGPAPVWSTPLGRPDVDLRIVQDPARRLTRVEARLRSAHKALSGYQVQVVTDQRGVQPVAIHLPGAAWSAHNLERGQCVVGWDGPRTVPAGFLVATFEYPVRRAMDYTVIAEGSALFE